MDNPIDYVHSISGEERSARTSEGAEPVGHRDVRKVRPPVVVHAQIEQALARRAVLVLLTRATEGGRDVAALVHSSDVDLVARVLEVEELWWNTGNRVILIRNERER